MQHKLRFRDQEEWKQNQNADSSIAEKQTYLHITVANSSFLIPISEIVEVSEMLPIRLYPVKIDGHLGMINLRGKVIPVISMERFGGTATWKSSDRLVIVHADETEKLAVIVNTVKKITTTESHSGSMMTLENKPVRILSGNQLLKAWESSS